MEEGDASGHHEESFESFAELNSAVRGWLEAGRRAPSAAISRAPVHDFAFGRPASSLPILSPRATSATSILSDVQDRLSVAQDRLSVANDRLSVATDNLRAANDRLSAATAALNAVRPSSSLSPSVADSRPGIPAARFALVDLAAADLSADRAAADLAAASRPVAAANASMGSAYSSEGVSAASALPSADFVPLSQSRAALACGMGRDRLCVLSRHADSISFDAQADDDDAADALAHRVLSAAGVSAAARAVLPGLLLRFTLSVRSPTYAVDWLELQTTEGGAEVSPHARRLTAQVAALSLSLAQTLVAASSEDSAAAAPASSSSPPAVTHSSSSSSNLPSPRILLTQGQSIGDTVTHAFWAACQRLERHLEEDTGSVVSAIAEDEALHQKQLYGTPSPPTSSSSTVQQQLGSPPPAQVRAVVATFTALVGLLRRMGLPAMGAHALSAPIDPSPSQPASAPSSSPSPSHLSYLRVSMRARLFRACTRILSRVLHHEQSHALPLSSPAFVSEVLLLLPQIARGISSSDVRKVLDDELHCRVRAEIVVEGGVSAAAEPVAAAAQLLTPATSSIAASLAADGAAVSSHRYHGNGDSSNSSSSTAASHTDGFLPLQCVVLPATNARVQGTSPRASMSARSSFGEALSGIIQGVTAECLVNDNDIDEVLCVATRVLELQSPSSSHHHSGPAGSTSAVTSGLISLPVVAVTAVCSLLGLSGKLPLYSTSEPTTTAASAAPRRRPALLRGVLGLLRGLLAVMPSLPPEVKGKPSWMLRPPSTVFLRAFSFILRKHNEETLRGTPAYPLPQKTLAAQQHAVWAIFQEMLATFQRATGDAGRGAATAPACLTVSEALRYMLGSHWTDRTHLTVFAAITRIAPRELWVGDVPTLRLVDVYYEGFPSDLARAVGLEDTHRDTAVVTSVVDADGVDSSGNPNSGGSVRAFDPMLSLEPAGTALLLQTADVLLSDAPQSYHCGAERQRIHLWHNLFVKLKTLSVADDRACQMLLQKPSRSIFSSSRSGSVSIHAQQPLDFSVAVVPNAVSAGVCTLADTLAGSVVSAHSACTIADACLLGVAGGNSGTGVEWVGSALRAAATSIHVLTRFVEATGKPGTVALLSPLALPSFNGMREVTSLRDAITETMHAHPYEQQPQQQIGERGSAPPTFPASPLLDYLLVVVLPDLVFRSLPREAFFHSPAGTAESEKNQSPEGGGSSSFRPDEDDDALLRLRRATRQLSTGGVGLSVFSAAARPVSHTAAAAGAASSSSTSQPQVAPSRLSTTDVDAFFRLHKRALGAAALEVVTLLATMLKSLTSVADVLLDVIFQRLHFAIHLASVLPSSDGTSGSATAPSVFRSDLHRAAALAAYPALLSALVEVAAGVLVASGAVDNATGRYDIAPPVPSAANTVSAHTSAVHGVRAGAASASVREGRTAASKLAVVSATRHVARRFVLVRLVQHGFCGGLVRALRSVDLRSRFSTRTSSLIIGVIHQLLRPDVQLSATSLAEEVGACATALQDARIELYEQRALHASCVLARASAVRLLFQHPQLSGESVWSVSSMPECTGAGLTAPAAVAGAAAAAAAVPSLRAESEMLRKRVHSGELVPAALAPFFSDSYFDAWLPPPSDDSRASAVTTAVSSSSLSSAAVEGHYGTDVPVTAALASSTSATSEVGRLEASQSAPMHQVQLANEAWQWTHPTIQSDVQLSFALVIAAERLVASSLARQVELGRAVARAEEAWSALISSGRVCLLTALPSLVREFDLGSPITADHPLAKRIAANAVSCIPALTDAFHSLPGVLDRKRQVLNEQIRASVHSGPIRANPSETS